MSKSALTRRSFLGGTLAATLLATASAVVARRLPRRRKDGLSSAEVEPALPLWIGHI